MSNMLKKGRRLKVREEKKDTKKRVKDFYAILTELDDVAELLKGDEEVTPQNLMEKAQALTERKIDKLETFILAGKLGFYEHMEKQTPAATLEVNGEDNDK
jgi:hypothetical protein